MRKIQWIVLCIAMLFTLAACSVKESPTPTEVTEAFLDAYHNKDDDQVASLSQWENFDSTYLSLHEEDYIENVDHNLQEDVYNMIMDFDHEEMKETIQDDHAVVDVKLFIYDFEDEIKNGMELAEVKSEELKKENEWSDEEIQTEIITIIFEEMRKAQKDKSITVEINLERVHGQWKVSKDNIDIQNRLLENMEKLNGFE